MIFVARESDPRNVRASLTRREGFGNDDSVGVLLDTFRDRRRAYLFIANPLGVQLDGVTTDGGDDDYSFDIGIGGELFGGCVVPGHIARPGDLG